MTQQPPTVRQVTTGAQLRSPQELRPHPDNPRGLVRETDPELIGLAESIAQDGLINPIVITPDGVILAGHRRQIAAMMAGCVLVPVEVRTVDPVDGLALMLAENVQRQDLTPLQQAEAAAKLAAHGLTGAQIAARIGRSAPYVSTLLRLAALPDAIREHVRSGKISANTAGAMARFTDRPDVLRRVLHEAVWNGMTAAMIDTLDDDGLRPPRPSVYGTGWQPAPGSYAAAVDAGTVPAFAAQTPARRHHAPLMTRTNPAEIAADFAQVDADAERERIAGWLRDQVGTGPGREAREWLLGLIKRIEANEIGRV